MRVARLGEIRKLGPNAAVVPNVGFQRMDLRRALPLAVGPLVAGVVFVAAGRADRAAHPVGTAKVTLLGAPATDATRLRGALRNHLRSTITLKLGSISRVVTRESIGARIDEIRLSALGRQLADPESPLIANAARTNVPVALAVPVALDAKLALAAIGSLKDDLDEPAQDAKVDLDQRKVIPEIAGRRIKVYETLAALEEALHAGRDTVEIAFEPIQPSVGAAALKDVDLTDTIGVFETKYNTDHKHADRTFNLRIAASRLNGKVILPGETFDFNAVVGPRDEAHGYRIAKVIADGELIDGIGGGTCQIAGTLHGAAFFAGLEIVQRTPHTRPSSYIKMGLDAAVAYPHVTLRLRNPFSHPVVLKETVIGGTVRAEILGPKRARIVTFIRKIEDILPFSEREVKDDRLPSGVRVITQRGIPGFKVRRYRVVREGVNAVREKTVDTYPPTQQIVHIGTGVDVSGGKPTVDDHPEYVADEYLTITQGAASASAAGDGMEEVRVAGKTGTKGWTRKYTTGSVTAVPDGDDEEPANISNKSSKKIASRKHKQ
jgi:vancomycin resistance protein YoaR